MTALPLAGRRVLEGKRILVMRAAHQAGKLSEGLRALGAVPVEVPVLEIQPPADPAPLDRALRILAAAHTDPCKADPCPILSASSAERTGNQAANSSASLQSGYDWLILTSANTVRALVERSEVLGLSLALGPQLQVAAVGEATAAAARKAGSAGGAGSGELRGREPCRRTPQQSKMLGRFERARLKSCRTEPTKRGGFSP